MKVSESEARQQLALMKAIVEDSRRAKRMSDPGDEAADITAYPAAMPRYKCHKEVHALKIKAVRYQAHPAVGPAILEFEEPGYAPLEVSGGYTAKHDPRPGGYYVVYKDGYESWSPGREFEEGYTRVLSALELGAAARRAGPEGEY